MCQLSRNSGSLNLPQPSGPVQAYIRIALPLLLSGGKEGVVGIATPGFEPRWGRNFPDQSRPASKPTQPPVQCLLPGGKRPGRGVDHPHLPAPRSSVGRVIPSACFLCNGTAFTFSILTSLFRASYIYIFSVKLPSRFLFAAN